MRLRAATAEDVAAVHALEVEIFGVDAWSLRSVREELTGPRRVAIVACDAAVVGYAVTVTAGDVVDLQRIAVVADHRRQGLARRLLARVVEEVEQVGRPEADRMLLEVSAANVGALRFYAAEGFCEVHRRRRYYRDGTDALVLERVLARDGRMAP